MSAGDARDAGEMHLLVGETRQVEPSAIAEREADEPRALEGERDRREAAEQVAEIVEVRLVVARAVPPGGVGPAPSTAAGANPRASRAREGAVSLHLLRPACPGEEPRPAAPSGPVPRACLHSARWHRWW